MQPSVMILIGLEARGEGRAKKYSSRKSRPIATAQKQSHLRNSLFTKRSQKDQVNAGVRENRWCLDHRARGAHQSVTVLASQPSREPRQPPSLAKESERRDGFRNGRRRERIATQAITRRRRGRRSNRHASRAQSTYRLHRKRHRAGSTRERFGTAARYSTARRRAR